MTYHRPLGQKECAGPYLVAHGVSGRSLASDRNPEWFRDGCMGQRFSVLPSNCWNTAH